MSTCWMNGKVVTDDQARISVFDHGLLYGDVIFGNIADESSVETQAVVNL